MSKSNRLMWVVGIAVVLIAAVGLVALLQQDETTEATPRVPLTSEISVAEAVELRDEGAFILDVRENVEWEDYHIPGSTLIPLGQLPDRLSELPEDQEIVVVCRSGNRSQVGRDILEEAGFTSVTSMAGGVSEWRASGHPTE